MPRRTKSRYAGAEVSEWTDEQRQRIAGLTPGKLEPLGFARWPKDPAEIVGFAPAALMALQRDAGGER